MVYASLIPFIILFISFVGFKLPLHSSAFIALLSGTLLTGTVFQSSPEVWNSSLLRTGEFLFEIGFIMFGAFFFLEAAKKAGVLSSLVALIRKISPNPVIQGVLVTFPLELMVEGSSGFGTPLLVITPILVALGFDLSLCVTLPLLSVVVGIPFGALGTPVRLGFPNTHPAHEVAMLLLPFTFIAPMVSQYLISKKIRFKETLWILLLALCYSFFSERVARTGPEFTALVPAFVTSLVGLASAYFFFSPPGQKPWTEKRGILTYGALILFLWIGKQIFMDQLIPNTHIRIFNPGYLFVIFAIGISLLHQDANLIELTKNTFERSKKTLWVFFCMTFIVQQMRANGGAEMLASGLPDFLLTSGAPILGWLGSSLVGTSTVSNLLFSRVISPEFHAFLGAGSSIGVQLAFQIVTALKTLIHDRMSEKEIFMKLAPLSALFILILLLLENIIL